MWPPWSAAGKEAEKAQKVLLLPDLRGGLVEDRGASSESEWKEEGEEDVDLRAALWERLHRAASGMIL